MMEFSKEVEAGVFKVVHVGSRGVYSPSVIAAYLKDPTWFEKSRLLAQERDRDLEGFDQYGYDTQGLDRAGFCSKDYSEQWFYEVNDDHIDAGELKFLEVLREYTLQWADELPLICKESQWPDLPSSEFVSGWQCNAEGKLYLG